ncbi:MAG: hypothetical protein SCJ94_07795 [Bacillota bacterium]|nr:hypothetical protein [Bacillota bacterium]MDW7729894.1 hypothetical protein [Bacillota bacterium]
MLANKTINLITIGRIFSYGGGCCGGCSFTEAIIDRGEPKEKKASHVLFKQDGLQIFVASILEKKTDSLTVGLKGIFMKRLSLDGYEADCPISRAHHSKHDE